MDERYLTYVCLFVCMCVCLYVCLFLYICVCMYVCFCIYVFVCMFVFSFVNFEMLRTNTNRLFVENENND